MARPRFDTRFRHLMSFLYSPERWTRTYAAEWTEEAEQLRWEALRWLYARAGVPTVGLSENGGSRNLLDVGPALSPTAPHVVTRLTEMEDVPGYPTTIQLTDIPYLRHLEQAGAMAWTGRDALAAAGPGLKIMLLPDGSVAFDDADQWSYWADYVKPYALRRALVPIQRELELSKSRRWGICPLCARVFPASRKTKACPPCRRKWTRRQIQWRLAHAPKDPVVFRVMPPSDPQSVRLSIARGIAAPVAIKRISMRSDQAIPENSRWTQ